MARRFDFGANHIDCATGSLSTQDGGPITIAGIVKLSDVRGGLLVLRTSGGTVVVALSTFGGNYFFTANGFTTIMASSTADNWHLIAVTKASGSATPRGHKYVYDTDTWTHADGAGALTDSGTTPGSNGVARIGRQPDGDSDNFQGEIAIMGVWNRVLADLEIEQLPFTLAGWHAAGPDALWLLDQSATTQSVPDLAGGGANQTSVTGTAVSTVSVPIFGYGASDTLTLTAPPSGGAGLVGRVAALPSSTGAVVYSVNRSLVGAIE